MGEPTFRPMNQHDVRAALEIIEDHDEDDFEAATATYQNSLLGQYVLEQDSQVIGITGASPIDGTDRSYVVSWTYLRRSLIGRGLGRVMMEKMIDQVVSEGCRKLFVSTSDYIDPEDGDIYRDAREAYRAIGFTEELRHRDYYAKGETQICLGLRLLEFDGGPVQSSSQKIRLTDIDEIDECDGAYWLSWEADAEGTETADFRMIEDQVRQWGGRVIFMAFPSVLTGVSDFMSRCRFKPDGRLLDYFEDGVDENHYRYDLF